MNKASFRKATAELHRLSDALTKGGIPPHSITISNDMYLYAADILAPVREGFVVEGYHRTGDDIYLGKVKMERSHDR